MISAPPAVFVVPLPNRDQLISTVSFVVDKFKKLGVSVELKRSEGPLFVECKVTAAGVAQRLDIYLSAPDDFATVTPVQEKIAGNFVERIAYAYVAQGVAVQINYEVKESASIKGVVVYAVGPAYRDLKL